MSQQVQNTSSNNPGNYESRASSVVISTSVFTALAVVCLSMRLFSRVFIMGAPGKDDLSITIAMICSIGVFVTELLEVKNGLGQHSAHLSVHDNEESSKFLWMSIIFYTVSITLSKMSLVFQYLRLFIGKKFQKICWITQVFLATYGIAMGIACIFICVPIPAFWKLPMPSDAQCISKTTVWFVHAGLNIASDVIIFVLPIPVISTLKLHLRTKISLVFIFGLGLFGTLVSILRLHSLYTTSVSTDLSWDNALTAIWSDIEINTAIICASLMAIRPLISRFFPNLLSSIASSAVISSVLTDPEKHTSEFMPLGSAPRTQRHRPTGAIIQSTATTVRDGEERGSAELSGGDGDIVITTDLVQEVGKKAPSPMPSSEGSEQELIIQKPEERAVEERMGT